MKNTFALVTAVAAFLGGCPMLAAEQGAITTTRLTEHLYQLSTDQGQYTTNSIVSLGEDGVLIVDTQAREHAEVLRTVVERFGRGLPKIIINTHRHVEHVGGNAIFGPEPVIIAHDLVRSKLRSGSYLFEEFPDATLPDITFSSECSLFFNGERIHLVAMPASHDDNEIIVHFEGSKVVHLSSLVNGFNFPSVDSDGDALGFPAAVAKALSILPADVVIVSGHNRNGTIGDLQAYHRMLVETIETVRGGLAAGKSKEQLQEDKAIEKWSSYAGSYVSADRWIAYLADALQHAGEPRRPDPFETMYHAIKKDGAEAAVALYEELRRERANEFDLGELDLLVIGIKLEARGDHQSAAQLLESSLRLYPESEYTYYSLYQLALAEEALGRSESALAHARGALDLQPENTSIRELVQRLENNGPAADDRDPVGG